ncbi:MAG: hypothetical protein WCL32_09815 [Planctomycetota bacterium]|jgi:hypothetical protein
MNKTDLQTLKVGILAAGRIEDSEVAVLRQNFYADGAIDRDEAEFLIDLRSGAATVCLSFEEMMFQAIKDNVLIDGAIDAEKAIWLRRTLFANDRIGMRERQLLWELITEARWTSQEFDALYLEFMK